MRPPDFDKRRYRLSPELCEAAITLGVLALLAVVVAVLISRITPNDAPAPPPSPQPLIDAIPEGPDQGVLELVRRPMLQLPQEAIQPQPLSTDSGGPAIRIPETQQQAGRWIPGSAPGTPEGALAQLSALDETALRGANPAAYTHGFTERSEPGAPPADDTGLYALLRSLRTSAGMNPTGMALGLTADYDVVQGQIKGTAERGNVVVACVLGQYSVDYRGQTVTAGVGDCQAMRWNGREWRIAATPLAAPAPNAWPGSADAVAAGYRDLREG